MAVQAAALGLVLAVIAWLRLDSTTRATVWAEDGAVFLGARLASGPVDSVLQVYAGYLHVVPRLLTELAVLVAPVDDYAQVVTALSCAVAGAVGAGVFVCSRPLVHSPLVRVALAAATVLVPAAPIEVMGNLANLHWYLLWLSPWLLLARPSRWRWSVVLGVVALLVGLTEIQAALFVPLAVVTLRDRRSWPAVIGLTTGVVAQVVASVAHPRPGPVSEAPSVLDLAKGYLVDVVLPIWHPSGRGAGHLLTGGGWAGATALAAPFVLLTVAVAAVAVRSLVRRRRPAPTAPLWIAIVLGATVPYVASMVVNSSPLLAYDSLDLSVVAARAPQRYGVVPGLFLVAGVLLWADRWVARATTWRRATGYALVAVTVATLAWHARVDGTYRSGGPTWASGVAAARAACAEGAPAVPVGAAPQYGPWMVTVPCDVLRSR